MTPEKFLTFTALAIVLTTAVKLFFIVALNIDNIYIVYVMWLAVALVSIACSRRLGVISYVEAVLVMGVWLALSLVLDVIVIATIATNDIYHHLYLWISYLVMALMVFLFHKKRHVEVRHIQRAAAPPPKHH